jgi:hypothetical protein
MAMLLTLVALQAVASAGPPAPPRPRKAAAVANSCQTPTLSEPGVIVVCAPRPQGYRLDPDVIAARKLHRNKSGPLRRELLTNTTCQTVGPGGCINPPTINVISAVATAVTMVKTALTGGNVGKLFVTTPEPSEYELYAAVKADREAAEAVRLDAAAAAGARSQLGKESHAE